MKKISEANVRAHFGRFSPISRISHVLAVISAAVVLAGCAASVQAPAPQAETAPAPQSVAPAPAPAPAPAAAAPQPKPETKPQPEIVLTSPLGPKQVETATVYFDFDKSELKPASIATLDALAAKAKGKTVEATIVVGHTDSIGTPGYNLKLSVRRAEAVKAHLTSKGIDPASVFTEGKGLSAPARSNDTEEGRAVNRRADVELVIVQ
ncbi:OmpA family protein [Hylemonella gracilis]|uniref:OmpA family protein n=1 Tax=Hylemonella gracilis TaxID=80880 RepID=A0A4P6UP40_9BURK|nr:OmpA family protein [Hylemonella gracilis]QBK05867.1 OmpA family protein [Hylemonella gracilis]